MLPWIHSVNDASEQVKGAIAKIPGLLDHLGMYKQECVPNAFEDSADNNPLYSFPIIENPPNTLFILSAVVCHAGNLQGGHYYSLINKFDTTSK